MKQCKKCKEYKEATLEYFPKEKRNKDELDGKCKECIKKYKNNYYLIYKQHLQEKFKEYRENNKEYLKQLSRDYHKRNAKQKSIYHKKWRKENKEKNRSSKNNWRNSSISFYSKSRLCKEIKFYEEVKESNNENLMCKCTYCGEWFEPTKQQIDNRLKVIYGITGKGSAECRLYCSEKCKENCPIYKQYTRSKDQKPGTSREVQPQLRQLVFERDNYTCQKCGCYKYDLDVGIHCHHIFPVIENPTNSADVDNCITYCENCHTWVHKNVPGCGYNEMKCAQ